MRLQELLALLAKHTGPQPLEMTDQQAGMQYMTTSMSGFVPPDLSLRVDAVVSSSPSVVVVSAAGAVGKSTLAREVAFSQGAPLIDLSACGPVGSYTLQGMLRKAFGASSSVRVEQSLAQGQLLLVIDALDEARVKVTEPAFEAFVADIADLAKSAPCATFVLFGRTQIAENSWLLLEGAGVAASLLVIEPFTRNQAETYIDGRMKSLATDASKLDSFAVPLRDARDLIFQLLTSAIGEGDASAIGTRDFLGYAPVLDAIAVLLAGETNYEKLKKDLSDDAATATPTNRLSPVTLLERVCVHILEREHKEKFRPNVKSELERLGTQHGWVGVDTLYGADEQCARLLCMITGTRLPDSGSRSSMPADLRASYEEHLTTWLPEHPFLRDGKTPANVVFESFLYARALSGVLPGLRPAIESRLLVPDNKASRLLSDFYLRRLDILGPKEEVPARHIGILYDSLKSAETDVQRVRLSIEGTDPEEMPADGEKADLEFEFFSRSPVTGEDELLGTKSYPTPMSPADNLVTFARRLRDATIVVPYRVQFGSGNSEFEVGPSVFVRCLSLSIPAQSLVVQRGAKQPAAAASSEDSAVVLESLRYEDLMAPRLRVHGELRVSWPGCEVFPWTEYGAGANGATTQDESLRKAFYRFRRIVMTLRSNGKGSLARIRDKVDHSRVLHGEMGHALLHRLLDDHILRLDGQFYHWVPDRATELVGVSWHDLRRGIMNPSLKRYLESFLASNQTHLHTPS